MAIKDQLKDKWQDLSPGVRSTVAIVGLLGF